MQKIQRIVLACAILLGCVTLTGCPDYSHQRPVPNYKDMTDSGGSNVDEDGNPIEDELQNEQ